MKVGCGRKALLFVGSGVHGELSIASPRKVTLPMDTIEPHQIASSEGHMLILSRRGTIFCGGSNHCGQIGMKEVSIEPYSDLEDFEQLFAYIEPFTAPDFSEEHQHNIFRTISCGPRSSAAISTEGDVFIWGTLTADIRYITPTIVPSLGRTVTQIALGFSHALLLVTQNEKSSVYAWGKSEYGALGLPESQAENPTEIPFFNTFSSIQHVEAGFTHSGVIVEDRDLFVFGECEYDPREGEKIAPHIPRVVCFLEPGRSKVDIVHMSKNISLIVIEGLVFGWGSGFCAILAHGEPKHSLSPHDIHLLYSDKSDPCVSLSCSANHIILATEKGKAFSCGSAAHGALGMGNSHQHYAEPEQIDIEFPVYSVTCCRGCSFFFGVPPIVNTSLEEILKYERGEIPHIVEFLIDMLKKPEHRSTEGIFRTSGASGAIDELLDMFNREKFTDDIYRQPTDSYTGLLKQFLRQLTPPLIPTSTLISFCSIFENEKTSLGRYDQIYDELQTLPKEHAILLQRLLEFLLYITQFQDENKMNSKNLVMCTLTGFYGHDIMRNMKRATTASAVLNMLIKDAPLWFGNKEAILPSQMTDLLDKKPFLNAVVETLFQAKHSFSPDTVQQLFITQGGFRQVCITAMSGEIKTEYEWEQFRDILQTTLPLSSDVKTVFDAVQSISSLEPCTSFENINSISVLLELLARSTTERPSLPILSIIQEILAG